MIHECWYDTNSMKILCSDPRMIKAGDIIRIAYDGSFKYIRAEERNGFFVNCHECPCSAFRCKIFHHRSDRIYVQPCSRQKLKLTVLNMDNIMENL